MNQFGGNNGRNMNQPNRNFGNSSNNMNYGRNSGPFDSNFRSNNMGGNNFNSNMGPNDSNFRSNNMGGNFNSNMGPNDSNFRPNNMGGNFNSNMGPNDNFRSNFGQNRNMDMNFNQNMNRNMDMNSGQQNRNNFPSDRDNFNDRQRNMSPDRDQRDMRRDSAADSQNEPRPAAVPQIDLQLLQSQLLHAQKEIEALKNQRIAPVPVMVPPPQMVPPPIQIQELPKPQPIPQPVVVKSVERPSEVQKSFKLEIFAIGHPVNSLTKQEKFEIEESILDVAIDYRPIGFRPQFLNIEFRLGVVVVDCANEKTAKWLKLNYHRIKAPSGKRLSVADENCLDRWEIVTGMFPHSHDYSDAKIKKIIESMNEGLITNDWEVNKRTTAGPYERILFDVNRTCLPVLEKKNCEIAYRFGKIKLTSKALKKSENAVDMDSSGDSTGILFDSRPGTSRQSRFDTLDRAGPSKPSRFDVVDRSNEARFSSLQDNIDVRMRSLDRAPELGTEQSRDDIMRSLRARLGRSFDNFGGNEGRDRSLDDYRR